MDIIETQTNKESYLTHSLVTPAPGADVPLGDVEAPSVQLPALVVADQGQVHRLQHVVVARTWAHTQHTALTHNVRPSKVQRYLSSSNRIPIALES